MLPLFPKFRPLALTDASHVARIAGQFLPYSDFSFVDLWSWNSDSLTCISQLNGNLAIKFSDQLTGQPFLTFIGDRTPNETACALIQLSEKEGLAAELRLVPRCCALRLDAARFAIIEEPEEADYIVSTAALAEYLGSDFKSQRNSVRRFETECRELSFCQIDLMCEEMQEQVRSLFKIWHDQKERAVSAIEEREYVALTRCLDSFASQLLGIGVYSGDCLIAFWLGQLLERGYAICNFEKAQTKLYPGAVPYLRQCVARLLLERGVHRLNLEQDLGIAGLRQSKRSYAPVEYLKKYRISL